MNDSSTSLPRHQRLALALGVLTALALSASCTSLHAEGDEATAIAEVLELAPGMAVADVGAGEGEWTVGIAERVGPEGKVWATEVADDELEELRAQLAEKGLERVEVVRGDQRDLGLPDGCCDAILLRMVYHHFEDPAAMRAELHRALRPGGRLAVIDIRPQEHWRELEGVPERGGHGILPADLEREMRSAGFRILEHRERWNDDPERYCTVFTR